MFWHGLWYSLTVLTILGVHELGHYCVCRYYRIDASLPYFLPEPVLVGTLGAFIRIPPRIPTKPVLFDIGVAGPVGGFLVAVPALFVGMGLSRPLPLPDVFGEFTVFLGQPLLFRFATWTMWGSVPDGYLLNLHPMAIAAWIGLLATAFDLFPVGRLDGGHISYAVFGAQSARLTVVAVIVVFAMALHSWSWILWAVVLVVMLVTFGRRHPRTVDHELPIGPTRVLAAGFALVIFVLCFTPTPLRVGGIQGLDLSGTDAVTPSGSMAPAAVLPW